MKYIKYASQSSNLWNHSLGLQRCSVAFSKAEQVLSEVSVVAGCFIDDV